MEPERGKTYYIDYGKKVPRAKCLAVNYIEKIAVMKYHWGTPWKMRFVVPFDKIVAAVKG